MRSFREEFNSSWMHYGNMGGHEKIEFQFLRKLCVGSNVILISMPIYK
jgi:hypothetical protein